MRLIYCQPTCFSSCIAFFANKIAMNLTMCTRDNYHNLFEESTRLLTIGRGQESNEARNSSRL